MNDLGSSKKQVQRFLSNDANLVMCVRAEDYDQLRQELAESLNREQLLCDQIDRMTDEADSAHEPPADQDTGRYCVERVIGCGVSADFHVWDGAIDIAKDSDAEALQALLNRAGPPPVPVLEYSRLRDALQQAMLNECVPDMRTEDDVDYRFVDLMSDQDSTIDTGKRRIEIFAERIADAVLEHLDSPALTKETGR